MLSSFIPGRQNSRRPKAPSNQTLEKIRAKQAEAQRTEQTRADAKAGKSPAPASARGPASAPAPEQANSYFSSIRNYMPSMSSVSWFPSGHDAPVTSLGESSKSAASQAASEGSPKHAEGRLKAKPEPESHEDEGWVTAPSSPVDASRGRAARSEASSSGTKETPTESKRGNPKVEHPEEGSSRKPRKSRGDDSVPVAKPNRRSKDSSKSAAAGSNSLKDSPVAQRSKEPKPDGWSLVPEKSRAIKKGLPQPVLDKAEEFKDLIRQGYEPAVAADLLGPATSFKRMLNTTGQYEIRLNWHHRLTFHIDPEKKVVTIIQVGGHS